MDKLLEFLNKRVEYLRGFGEDNDEDLELDGEEIYGKGVGEGRFKEAVFLRDKIRKLISE